MSMKDNEKIKFDNFEIMNAFFFLVFVYLHVIAYLTNIT